MLSRSNRLVQALLVAIALFGMAAGAVRAQEISPEQLELAQQYLDITQRNDAYKVALLQVGRQTMRTIVEQNPDVAEKIAAVIEKTLLEYDENSKDLLLQFARVVAQRFTADELREIVAFYKTDTGKKLSDNNFAITRDLAAVLQIYQTNLQVEFYAKVKATLKEQGVDI